LVRDPRSGRNALPVEEALLERVRELLRGAPKLEEKRMFGGIGFMVRGKLCVSVGPGRVMCRIDPETHDAVVARKTCSTVVMRGRPMRGYVRVKSADVKGKRELDYWVKISLDYNAKIARARVKAKPRRPAATVDRSSR